MKKNDLLRFVVLFMLLTPCLVFAEKTAPETITGARTISTETARLLLRRGYPFVDVRGQSDFDRGHLPGAHHLSVKSEAFTAENLSHIAARDQVVVFYCNGVACLGSAMATEKAVQWGWQKVFYYRDGFKGWQQAGY